jgi:7,8-dihydropterin-6-yl-methyl-4-(beta-D-ribofuranosyl)aminobenzene 5'-phosphate synthase
MKLQVVCDNRPHDERLRLCWGFSCLVGKSVLFDTGEMGEILRHNMEQLHLTPQQISTVIISHDHYDHTGGLDTLLEQNPKIKVHALSPFFQRFHQMVERHGKDVLVEEDQPHEVESNVYTTGLIGGSYGGRGIAEQSLVIKTPSGMVVITGCAHPGIIKIVDRVRDRFGDPLRVVMGGFHLMQDSPDAVDLVIQEFLDRQVQRVAPTHCTGEDAIEAFSRSYGEKCLDIGAGSSVTI